VKNGVKSEKIMWFYRSLIKNCSVNEETCPPIPLSTVPSPMVLFLSPLERCFTLWVWRTVPSRKLLRLQCNKSDGFNVIQVRLLRFKSSTPASPAGFCDSSPAASSAPAPPCRRRERRGLPPPRPRRRHCPTSTLMPCRSTNVRHCARFASVCYWLGRRRCDFVRFSNKPNGK
jgi:hypothetical protein